jgi:hypothetical protein
MSVTGFMESSSALLGDEQALDLITAALAELPPQERNEIVAFLDFWRDLRREERALFAKSVKPDLADEQIARLAGVSVRTLYRLERFQNFKASLESYLETKRRQWYLPDDSLA